MENNDFDAMFDNNNDVFSGLDDCETWDRLPWFEANHRYLLEVDSVKFIVSNDDPSVRYYVITFTILESSCPELPVGTRASHRIKCTSDRLRAYGPMNIKQFLSAMTGMPATRNDVPWTELGKAAVSDGVFNGKKVRLQTTLNKNGTFTNHTYQHVAEE